MKGQDDDPSLLEPGAGLGDTEGAAPNLDLPESVEWVAQRPVTGHVDAFLQGVIRRVDPRWTGRRRGLFEDPAWSGASTMSRPPVQAMGPR
jgi:hypothetical protein